MLNSNKDYKFVFFTHTVPDYLSPESVGYEQHSHILF